MDLDGDDSFKRPGAIPFTWEIRPGIPKTRPDHDPSLLQPPKKLPPLRLKPSIPPSPPSKHIPASPFDPSNHRSASPFGPSNRRSVSPFDPSQHRPASPFDPPPSSYKLKPSAESSGPPTPYFKSSSPRGRLGLESGASFRRWRFPKSIFGLKKSKSGADLKKMTSSEFSDESESTEDSSRGSTWGSPRSSVSSSSLSRGGSYLKRNQSDLTSSEKKTISIMARSNHF